MTDQIIFGGEFLYPVRNEEKLYRKCFDIRGLTLAGVAVSQCLYRGRISLLQLLEKTQRSDYFEPTEFLLASDQTKLSLVPMTWPCVKSRASKAKRPAYLEQLRKAI
ncbi:hypothetical protein RRG08_001636 [Elysia crispata]|uniref:Uncharacterized protein n=1 Tax=Elysia crispata TaxID=231223 RepID=A0AAE1ALA7_9GAST|nr:hypothetical protein RRG08_001636 [Elysia crispata]